MDRIAFGATGLVVTVILVVAFALLFAHFVGRRAALYAGAILLATLPLAPAPALPPTTDFAALVPRLAVAFAPWTPLVPFVFTRPRRLTRARVAIAAGLVAAVAADVLLRRVLASPIALAAALGASLDDVDRAPDLLMALLTGALAFLMLRELEPHRALRLASTAIAAIAVTVLALRPRWMPAAIAAGAGVGLVLRVVEHAR